MREFHHILYNYVKIFKSVTFDVIDKTAGGEGTAGGTQSKTIIRFFYTWYLFYIWNT